MTSYVPYSQNSYRLQVEEVMQDFRQQRSLDTRREGSPVIRRWRAATDLGSVRPDQKAFTL